MCYNNCEHFRFNPMEGTDRCVRGKNPCPAEICADCLEIECVCEEWEKNE